MTEFSSSTNLIVKKMRLVGDESQSADSALAISRSLVKYYLNYKKSGIPKRLMFYKNGDWSDYPEHVVDLVKKYFEIKKETVEVELDGHGVVLDFLHMYNVNLKTSLRQPIVWIDEAGSCFFPELFAGSDEEHSNLGYGGLDVDSAQNIFLTGMTTFGVNKGDIVDVYRSSGISMQARLELFQKQANITKGIHGDANVRFACMLEKLSTMMKYGLGHNAVSSSKCIYGFGIHLADITHPYAW